jgi:hypothetical protein
VLTRDAAMLPNYPLSVASSLSLSLSRIALESSPAREVLNCLAYLAPDNISKPLFAGVCIWVRAPPTPCHEARRRARRSSLSRRGAKSSPVDGRGWRAALIAQSLARKAEEEACIQAQTELSRSQCCLRAPRGSSEVALVACGAAAVAACAAVAFGCRGTSTRLSVSPLGEENPQESTTAALSPPPSGLVRLLTGLVRCGARRQWPEQGWRRCAC